jgi:hypothetical protein
MIIRYWKSDDKMEEIVRIDNSPYAEYRKCYYEARKYIEAVPQEKLFMEITDDLKALIYVGKEYVDALYEVLKMDYLEKYTLEDYNASEANSSYKGGKKEDWKGEDDDEDDEEGGGYHKTVNCSNQ